MIPVKLLREDFLYDRQGRTFSDLVSDSPQVLDELIGFFNDENRQRRMQESEIHHDRAPLAGVVRELESQSSIDRLLSSKNPRRSQRLRQAVGVIVRMVMEKSGWKKTGKKGSLGVRASAPKKPPYHNSGGLAFWFLRAERYVPRAEDSFASVKKRCKILRNSRRIVRKTAELSREPGANATNGAHSASS